MLTSLPCTLVHSPTRPPTHTHPRSKLLMTSVSTSAALFRAAVCAASAATAPVCQCVSVGTRLFICIILDVCVWVSGVHACARVCACVRMRVCVHV